MIIENTTSRGTGRTMRMLEFAAEASKNDRIVVVISHMNRANHMETILKSLNANMDNIGFYDWFTASLHSPAEKSPKIYWDHFAIDLYEQHLINNAIKKCDELRRSAYYE